MKWTIDFDTKAKKELLKLDKQIQKRIINFLEDRILKKDNPRAVGTPLRGSLSGFWRYRVGDYRIISIIEDNKLHILVISVKHRKKVYKQLN